MLRPDGYVEVLDFWIAKRTEQRLASHDHTVETTAPLQTRPGLVLGTARYMSPEQARGQKVDVRTDIWSLGVVFYEMVGGIPPFRGDTPSDCIASILTAEPPPLSGILTDVPLKLESILQKALRKNSDERYHTIKEMLADLRLLKEELEADSSLPQTKAPAESIVSKIKHHKRSMLFTLAGALLAAAVVYSFYFVAPAPLPNEKTIADRLRAKLTGQEEQVIAARPTDNPEAYDAYLRGLAYTLKTGNSPANTLAAQKYLKEAVRLDSKFALAWALLSYVDALGYLTLTLQPTVALREETGQAAETALTLQPNLGEAIMARGYYYYACLKDYDAAVRYFEQARQFLPNSSQIPESLAYVARRRGQWDRSEAYFNEAERLDPRNVNLLTAHAASSIVLRRFPEALRKLEQVLDITPDDVDTLAEKAAIAQAEGDLPRASALLAPLHPNADDTIALGTQIYQAILERRPAQVIPRLEEILAKPDPALGYFNGELPFWLGWAQEVAGDRATAHESWKQARSELEPLLKEQPENYILIGDLALTNMGLGDKAAALALVERAMALVPIEKDALVGPRPIEVLARVAARSGDSDRAIAA